MDAKIFQDLSDDEILAAFDITHSQMPNLYFVDVVDNGAVIFWLTKPVPEEAAWRGSPYLMEEIKDLTYYGVAMFHQEIWWDSYMALQREKRASERESQDAEAAS